MAWRWDPAKDEANRARHGLSFATASLVFDDPLALSQPDPHPGGDRWQTLGAVGGVILFVVHTWPDDEDGDGGRIISARKATAHERRAYEEE
ncbi:MAG TPA: BrnT family toxin [Allosphingosinicella sp.]|nr:BrnT family toxin [Allosphingosinicella sp.]